VPEQLDRRTHRRLPLRLPLIVSGGRESGHFVEETTSENVSAGGVFFSTGAWALMPLGTRLFIAMQITSPDGQFAQPSQLRTVGHVVRLAQFGDRDEAGPERSRGVAVAFERELRFSS
jgi:hypothetical protein